MLNPWLITAVCLLLFPIGVLLPKSVSMVGYERGTWPRGLILFLLLLDPIRAGLGAWAFIQGMGPLSARIGFNVTGDAILMGAIFAVGIVIQTLSRKEEDFVFSPFGYTAGVLVIFCGPLVGAIALALGFGSAIAMRVWTPFFVGASIVVALLGSAIKWVPIPVALAVGLACLLPPLVSVMMGRHMGFPRR